MHTQAERERRGLIWIHWEFEEKKMAKEIYTNWLKATENLTRESTYILEDSMTMPLSFFRLGCLTLKKKLNDIKDGLCLSKLGSYRINPHYWKQPIGQIEGKIVR